MGGRRAARRVRVRRGPDALRVPRRHLHAPWDRWDHDLAGASDPSEAPTVAAASSGRVGGWIVGASRFDPAAFGVSLAESSLMDPQQRLLLEAVASLVRCPTSAPAFAAAAGLPGARASSAGLVAAAVGLSVVDYSRVVPDETGAPPNPYLGAGNAVSAACGRLSYTFGFRGASLAIDTACSSSLVAAHVARDAVAGSGSAPGSGFGGVTVGAVAAGAALVLAPHATSIFAAAGMLAPDGRCKTLDADADGYVRTEAVWAMPLWSTTAGESGSRASRGGGGDSRVVDDDGVVGGEPDGRSASLTAPNGPSQQAVLTAAARGASPALDRPADALEMHGTGTALGDPIEFRAAVAAFAAREGFARFERFSKGGGMRPSSDGNRGNRPSSDGKDASAANGTAANGTPLAVPVSGERDAEHPATPNTPHTAHPRSYPRF